ncbi:MAG: hypothetical protein U1F70_05335 [Candidatus Competibacteraceae bacterium]
MRTISISTAASNRSMIVTASCLWLRAKALPTSSKTAVRRQQWPLIVLIGQVESLSVILIATVHQSDDEQGIDKQPISHIFFAAQIKVEIPWKNPRVHLSEFPVIAT